MCTVSPEGRISLGALLYCFHIPACSVESNEVYLSFRWPTNKISTPRNQWLRVCSTLWLSAPCVSGFLRAVKSQPSQKNRCLEATEVSDCVLKIIAFCFVSCLWNATCYATLTLIFIKDLSLLCIKHQYYWKDNCRNWYVDKNWEGPVPLFLCLEGCPCPSAQSCQSTGECPP